MSDVRIPYMNYRELTKELKKQGFQIRDVSDGIQVWKGDNPPLTLHKSSVNSEGPIYRTIINTLLGHGFVAPAERKKSEVLSKRKTAPEGFDPQCPYCSRNNFRLPLHKMRHVKSAHREEWNRDHPEDEAKPEPVKAPRAKAGPVRVRQVQPESKAHQIKLLVRQASTAYRTIDTVMPEIIRISEELEEENKTLKGRIDKYEEEWTRMIDRLPRG